MPRGPGRDQGVPLRRLVRILTALAQESPGFVNRDQLMTELEYGDHPLRSLRDQLARDLRYLRDKGWGIEKAGQGEQMRLRLLHRDPRLRTLLAPAQIEQLARAVGAAGRDPRELGLPRVSTESPPSPLPPGAQALELEEVLHALHHRCVLTITYRGRCRRVDVDDVQRTDAGRWLVVGREDGDLGQKTFRLDRIEDLRVGRIGSASPRQPVREDADPLTFADGDPVDAVVTTTQEHEALVVAHLGAPRVRRESDGDVELTIPVVNHWLWRMRLYQLGVRVRLTGPADLCAEVRTELRAFVRDAS